MRRIVSVAITVSLLAAPAYADNTAICFPETDASRLLKVVEKDLPDCQAGLIAADEVIEADENRIDELRGERDQCREDGKKAKEASEQAIKAAREPWYQRVISIGKWVAGALLIGYVAGASK